MVNLAEDRQRELLETIRAEGGVVIREIAGRLGVSEMTVRRDLRAMEGEGLVRRVHGGAVAPEEARFGQRLLRQTPGKKKATAKLAQFLPERGTIYLDGSTTMLQLVAEIGRRRSLQVATNNVETFQRLARLGNRVKPLLVGGSLDRRTDNMVGALALRSILAIAFDAAFFSAWGLSAQLGPMEATIEDAEVKDLVASRSRAVYLACDRTKLGRSANGVWAPEPARSTLATDLAPGDNRIQPLAERFQTIL